MNKIKVKSIVALVLLFSLNMLFCSIVACLTRVPPNKTHTQRKQKD